MNQQPAISLKNVSKHFRSGGKTLHVLENINLEINHGEFFVIVGPSGSGKSTLLRLMSGLEKDFSGKVEMGQGMSRSDMAFVFQQFALFPWMTVADNIALGLVARGRPKKEIDVIVDAKLRMLGLEKFRDEYPKSLSGGMRQRVGIARALATSPKVIFMDEPFSELDSFTAEALRQEMLEIWKKESVTIIMVTHLIDEALELADRIAVLSPLPGKIEKILPNTLARPRVKRSAELYAAYDAIYKLIQP